MAIIEEVRNYKHGDPLPPLLKKYNITSVAGNHIGAALRLALAQQPDNVYLQTKKVKFFWGLTLEEILKVDQLFAYFFAYSNYFHLFCFSHSRMLFLNVHLQLSAVHNNITKKITTTLDLVKVGMDLMRVRLVKKLFRQTWFFFLHVSIFDFAGRVF
jgi:hypothetical protein